MDQQFRRRVLRINTLTSSYRGVWEELRIKASLPPRRCNHSASIVKNKLIVYGGQDMSIGVFSDTWILNIDLNNFANVTWSEVIGLDDAPPPLCRHSSLVYNDLIFIFGGTDLCNQSNLLYTFNPESFEWKIYSTEAPAIDSHSAVVYCGKMIVFGGYLGAFMTNSVFVMDLEHLTWTRPELSNKPMARAYHRALIHDRFMLVFGGTSEESNHLQDMWRLDLENWSWQEITAGGEHPGGISGHSICVYGDVILVFGGIKDMIKETNEMYTYDIRNNIWVLIQSEAEVPDPVTAAQYESAYKHKKKEEAKKGKGHVEHSQTFTTSSKTKKKTALEINAKRSVEEPTPVVVRLYQGPHAPTEGRIRGKVPHSRDGHSANLYENYMIIFGGDRYQMPFNDTYIYSVSEYF